MSWGVALRNAVGLGLGGIPSLRNAPPYASLAFNFLSGQLDPRITFTRVSTGTYVNSSGVLTSAAINTPRFDYDPVTLAAKGLLIEEQRTNSIRNNTMQGAVAGTPGTLPTNWFIGNLAGLSTQVVAIGTESGVSYIDLRIFGTSTTTNFILNFEPTTQIPALQNQSWTGSFFVTYVAGTLTNVQNFSTTITERDSAGALLSTSTALRNLTNTPLVQNRYVNSYTLPTATAAYVTLRLDVGVAATSAIDITLRIGLPQLELGAFATSVIPTTTAAATRAADVLSITGANFSSWYNQAEGTTLVEAATLPNVTATVITYAISDGTFNQSIYGTFITGNTYRGANVLDGGVAQANLIANFAGLTTTNNTKDAFAYKLNDFAESCNGVATRTDTAGTVPAVNRLYIGSSWSGNSNFLNGHIRSFKYYPTRLSNVQLQSLTFVPQTLWTPAQIPTALWLDANDASTITLNGSTVSQWADKSGNGRNVSQANASSQPTSNTRTLNGLNVLDFNADVIGIGTPFVTINTPWLVYSVITFDSFTGNPVYIGLQGAQTTHMGWSNGGNIQFCNNSTGVVGLSGVVITANTPALVGVQYDTTNLTGLYNGAAQGSPAVTIPADTALFNIGSHSSGASNYFDGTIGEIVFVQSSVSLSNRQKLEGYLAWKWGLQANLPVGHPYKNAAPTV